MLNLFCRPVTSTMRTRLTRMVLPLATVWLLAPPMAHAAETMPMSQDMASAPFGQYQKWRDEPVQDWAASNDRVGEIGGWMTYLRDAQPADDAAGAGAASQGHQGQHGH